MTTITVDLGPRSYPLHIGHGLLSSLANLLPQLGVTGRVGLVSSEPIFVHYGALVTSVLAASGCHVTTAMIPADESAKSLEGAARLYDTFLNAGLDRTSTLLALGGGVIGDLTGFVAATFMRGIAWVQLPTTLLAMVDASIGGKTGVNHRRGKNLIGAFHQPLAVIIDPTTLGTLPGRELISAYTELLKAGAIADRNFFRFLSVNAREILALADRKLVEEAIVRAGRIKAEVVAADEREGDRRRILNFGHTLGHALEAASGYGDLRHGEAVAFGMAAAGYLSRKITGLPEPDYLELLASLELLDLPPWPALDRVTLMQYLYHDKKVKGGELHFVLLKELGRPVITNAVDDGLINAALDDIEERWK
ncbi:MAG: 3-dehydroquinate synthase [Candidatus Neomarinimicrobiota bacterium]